MHINHKRHFSIGCYIPKPFVVFLWGMVLSFFVGSNLPATAASGLFLKTPAAAQAKQFSFSGDTAESQSAAWALQGLVNRTVAEVYIPSRPSDMEHLINCRKPFTVMPQVGGSFSGLKTLFQKYQTSVQRMCIYDPAKDWTFYLAVMAGAQSNGIPVTASLASALQAQFPGWAGTVVDYRNIGTNRIEGYDWALANLMPNCTRQSVFITYTTQVNVLDYAVASKSFIFNLDTTQTVEANQADKIFATSGYGVGTSLGGYGVDGDGVNTIANKYGIGYVVSDWYSNGSFWSSFPNKTYTQRKGIAVPAQNGKVYVSFILSDGDNIQIDQELLYQLWKDPARGSVPVGTSLSPALQEFNSPLLDYYYANKTTNDELIAGPCGFQFIYLNNFNKTLLPQWGALNALWCADAGFHATSVWLGTYPSANYSLYTATCGMETVFHNFNRISNPQFSNGVVVFNETIRDYLNIADVYSDLSAVASNPAAPVFTTAKLIAAGNFNGAIYTAIKGAIDQLNANYPGKYVFLLPSDLGATAWSHYACSTPTLSLPAGNYFGAQSVTISSTTAGATIHYTTDGSTPTTSSPSGPNGLTIPLSPPVGMTIKAIARLTGKVDSRVASSSYAVTAPPSIWVNPQGGSWATATNWSNNTIANGIGTTADFSTLALPSDATVTLDGARTNGNLVFDDQNPVKHGWTLTSGSGGPLTLASVSGAPVVSNTAAVDLNLTLAGTQGLQKNGTGTLTLPSANTYTGATTVNAGTLKLAYPGDSNGGVGTLAVGSSITVNSGATLLGSAFNALGHNGTPGTHSSDLLTINRGATFTIDAGLVLTMPYTLNVVGGTISSVDGGDPEYGTIYYGSTTGTFTSANDGIAATLSAQRFNLGNGVPIHVTDGSGAVDLNVTGTLIGGALVKNGDGTMVLSGANSYTGNTTISGGTLQIGNASTTGTLGSGSVTIDSGAVLAINRSDSYGTVTDQNFSGAGTLVKEGSGDLVFNGNENHTAAQGIQNLTINGGLVRTDRWGLWKSDLNLAANGAGVFELWNTTASLGTLNGDGTVRNTQYFGRPNTTLNVAAGSFSGTITDSGSATSLNLVKSGVTTLTLSGTNSYTGTTNVQSGTLLVNGPGSLPSASAVSVAGVASLGGNGTINGSVNVAAGGSLVPGRVGVIGTLTLANNSASSLTLNGSSLNFDLPDSGTTGDRINLTGASGALVLNGANFITLNAVNTTVSAGIYTLMTFASKTGAGTLTFPNGLATIPNATLAVGSTSVTLTVGLGGLGEVATWRGNVSGVWDGGALNWNRQGISSQAFMPEDIVIFDDTGSTAATISSSAAVAPKAVVFNNSASHPYTVSAVITGTATLEKIGLGTTTLTGANTYTGATTINSGILKLAYSGDNNGGVGTLAVGGSITVNSGGTLLGSAFNALGHSDTHVGDLLTINQGGVFTVDAGLVLTMPYTLNVVGGTISSVDGGDSEYGTIFYFSTMGTFTSANDGTAATISAQRFNLGGAPFDVTDGSGAVDLNVTGTLIGGPLVKSGDGTMVLSGDNTFTGNTAITQGTLNANLTQGLAAPTSGALGNPTAAGRTVTISSGATLNFSQNDVMGNADSNTPLTLIANGGSIKNSGAFFNKLGAVQLNGGTLSSTGGNSGGFPSFALGGTVTIGGSTVSTISTSGSDSHIGLMGAGTTFDVADAVVGSDLNVTGVLADWSYTYSGGGGRLIKTGVGTMTLSGANSYAGATTVNAGTLVLGGSGVIPNASPVSLGAATLAAATAGTETAGTLGVTAAATINLATGARLAFTSGTATWAGSLDITGAFVSGLSLRFGSSSGLSATQLAAITLNGGGGPFTLNGSGFLVSGSNSAYALWQSANSTTQTANLDHDNDGVSNGVEHFLGGIANTTGNSNPLPGVTNTAGILSVTWAKAAAYAGTYGTDFWVETSATLSGAWATESYPGGNVTITGNVVKYTFSAGTKNFVRLKVLVAAP